MLREWEKKFQGASRTCSPRCRIVPSHLMDGTLHDFKHLRPTGVADDNGDKAFDEEEFPAGPALGGLQVVQL
jgi:tRNA 2-thiocytidine biosynthesis protein TtcA